MISSYDISDLLKKFISDGFTFESLSMITGSPIISLKRLYHGEQLSAEEIKDLDCAMTFLLFIYMENTDHNDYLKTVVDVISDRFAISINAIAKYLGLNEEQFHCFVKNPEKQKDGYQLTVKLLHLYTTIFRDKKYYSE